MISASKSQKMTTDQLSTMKAMSKKRKALNNESDPSNILKHSNTGGHPLTGTAHTNLDENENEPEPHMFIDDMMLKYAVLQGFRHISLNTQRYSHGLPQLLLRCIGTRE